MSGPGPGEALRNHDSADVRPANCDGRQAAAVAVDAGPFHDVRAIAQKFGQALCRPRRTTSFGSAFPLDLRRIDASQPDLLPGNPNRVTIDDTGKARRVRACSKRLSRGRAGEGQGNQARSHDASSAHEGEDRRDGTERPPVPQPSSEGLERPPGIEPSSRQLVAGASRMTGRSPAGLG